MTRADNAETANVAGCCSGGHDHSGRAGHADRTAIARDLVCGMTVDPATSKHRFEYRGDTFHFCSAGCRAKFAANPSAYLDHSKRTPPCRR